MSQISKASTGGGGSEIQTINGDFGSISGTIVTVFAGNASNTSGGSVYFDNSGTISTLHLSDTIGNTYLGEFAGNTSGLASDNLAVGAGALNSVTTSSGNVALGSGSLGSLTGPMGGSGANIAIGTNAGSLLLTGTDNLLIGNYAGNSYTSSEEENILVNNVGVLGESNVTRIGTQFNLASGQNACFIAGIQNVTTPQPGVVTINTTTGQLANVSAGTSGNVLISNGTNWTSAPIPAATAFSVAMNVSQSIAQNALNDVVYDTALVDTASGFSAGVYTIPRTGNWEFNISAVFKSTVSFINCDIFLNMNSGTLLLHGQPCVSVSDPSAVTVNAGGMFPMIAGDTVKISVFAQTTGGTNYDCSGFANGYYNTFIGILIT